MRQATYEGAGRRWPAGIPAKVQDQIAHELDLICDLRYEHYFLTVFDIVSFARSQHILCQGRGSAANSVVCYCLGVTEVDPARMSVLFERFISKERNEPPDIDIDFEHERREEVIQYLYGKYGRDRAALAAAVITYGPKSAICDVGNRARLEQHEMKLLAAADALTTLSGHRRQQVWDAAGLHAPPELLQDAPVNEDYLELQAGPEGEEIVWDYASTGLTLRRHPLALLRPKMAAKKLMSSRELQRVPNGRVVRTAGIVTLRQQPATAKGTIFVSLEDEFGSVQVIVWSSVREGQRQALLESRMLAVKGMWQRNGAVCNLIRTGWWTSRRGWGGWGRRAGISDS